MIPVRIYTGEAVCPNRRTSGFFAISIHLSIRTKDPIDGIL